jgi:beta-mannosidase
LEATVLVWLGLANRILQTGIWDNVTLEISHDAEIDGLRCSTDVDIQAGKCKLKVWGSVRGGSKVRITLKDKSRELGGAEVKAQDFSESAMEWDDLPVDLWWPNRTGAQRLYDLELELFDDHGRLLDRQSRKIGFKNIQWQRTKGAAETPIRPNFADVREEDYVKRANVYRDCGTNLVRVWGGGFLEKESFYTSVTNGGCWFWQEFLLSSSGLDNYPPDDPACVDELGKIAESYIDRRSHHVSLLLWCGGNELQDDKNGVKSSQPTLTIRHHPAIVKMGDVVASSDPGHRFLPTTPLGPVGMFTLQDREKGWFWMCMDPGPSTVRRMENGRGCGPKTTRCFIPRWVPQPRVR